MKSKSMSAHGSSTLAWVCRWSSGLRSASSPAIHIFAGLKVCIHAMTPITSSRAFTSSASRRMLSASVSTGFQTTRTGLPCSPAATCWDWSATCRNVSSPYKVWLPVTNQTS